VSYPVSDETYVDSGAEGVGRLGAMRVVITGATGNVGTSLVTALGRDERVTEIVGLARRRPAWNGTRTRWVAADITTAPLEELFAGADAVVHLAWLIQPSRDERTLEAVNVGGSRRVFEAAAAAGVGTLVHASSVGTYSPGPSDRRVAEDWPVEGIKSSFYSRHKAACERALDELEVAHPGLRVVRLRPGLIFKRGSATEIRRLFAGPFLPSPLVRPGLIFVVPDLPGLALQAVHADDVAEAYRLAVVDPSARGAYNIAAEPVLDVPELCRLLRARPLRLHPRLVRALTTATWRLRLQPTPPGWLDMGLLTPLLDVTRARTELGWEPRRSAGDALLELLAGMRDGAGLPTPPLDPATSGPLRSREIAAGVGGRGDPGL
jgi:UDP-glucose 4-epimerase